MQTPHDDPDEDLETRNKLLTRIRLAVRAWGVPDATAAERLEIDEPELRKLMNGRVEDFSLDELLNLTLEAGLGIEFDLRTMKIKP